MSTNKIKYRKGYKYQLAEDLIIITPIIPKKKIVHEFFTLDIDGVLCVKRNYAWDGCSAIAYDTNTNMRAGCAHDSFFQMMRLGLLDRNTYFHQVNQFFHIILLEDGMIKVRAWYYFKAVENFSWSSTLAKEEPLVLIAP